MFWILDILVLILVRRRACEQCGRKFWAAPPHTGRVTAVGREDYVCECGYRYHTGRREWDHLSSREKHQYLWSGIMAILIVITALAALGGYFLKWHEPYWFMSVFIGLLGLFTGVICSGVLLALRSVPIFASRWRTKHSDTPMAEHGMLNN